MSLLAFNQLTQLIEPFFHLQHKPLRIPVEIVLHYTIRWLAGGSYEDISAVVNVSVPTFYRYVHLGMTALTESEQLRLRFPESDEALGEQCAPFADLSSHGALQGCVGALDGWLCRIRQPSKEDADSITPYFSGHYHAYGLNVQATCDHLCRFTSVSIQCPGGTNDARAHQVSDLQQNLMKLPLGMYLVGDNAYTISERLLTPYCATDGMDFSKDNFNFFLSQLRIRIEQAFGFMVTKWRIFKKPLEVKLQYAPRLIQAVMVLHNFCINSRVEGYGAVTDIEPAFVSTSQGRSRMLGYIPASVDENRAEQRSRTSLLREKLREHIQSRGLIRPGQNAA